MNFADTCFWSIFLGQSLSPSNFGCRNLNSTSSTGLSGSCENIYNVKKRGYVSLDMNNWGDWGCKSLLFHAKRSSLTDKTLLFIHLKLVIDDFLLAEMLVFKKYLQESFPPIICSIIVHTEEFVNLIVVQVLL